MPAGYVKLSRQRPEVKDCPLLMRAATPLDQPRALGAARLSTKCVDGRSCIDGLRQSGALKLLFPRTKERVEAIVINTAGGITGGDRFELRATAGAGTRLALTTQAAERAYRAQAGQTGRTATHLEANADSVLHWLPQETIIYQEAAFERSLRVALHPTARFVMVEPIVFGRKAMGEHLSRAHFRDRVDIRRNGKPLYRDGVDLSGDIAGLLNRPAVAGGARAMAALVWHAPEAEAQLSAIRAMIGPGGGASLLDRSLLVARILAPDGFEMRQRVVPILEHVTGNSLPQSWRL
ncbi:MAG: urease accessory protein UreD [Pseudomonadota bacterium]